MSLHPQFWWWVSRSTGIVAWVGATVTVAWGLLLSGRLAKRRRLPAWVLDLHSYLGTLTIAFVALHLVALVADSYVAFDLRDLFVPMASTWKPGPVAWGIVAMYGLVIVQGTSWIKRRLPERVWHAIHLASYAVFVAATVHTLSAGYDSDNRILQFGVVIGCTVVITLTIVRIIARQSKGEAAASDERAARIAAAKERALARTAAAPADAAGAAGSGDDDPRPGSSPDTLEE